MLKRNETTLLMKLSKLRISLNSTVTETFHNNKLLKVFRKFNITATEQDINEFVIIDEESSHLFQEEILEEANLFFLVNSKQ